MPESDEALLRRAAALVRERGKAATQGPWRFDGETGGNDEIGWPSECSVINTVPVNPRGVRRAMTVVASGVADENVDADRDYLVPEDAAWIALVGPQCAEPLAAWLETEASWLDRNTRRTDQPPMPESGPGRALAVARALLSEAPTAPVGDDPEEEK